MFIATTNTNLGEGRTDGENSKIVKLKIKIFVYISHQHITMMMT